MPFTDAYKNLLLNANDIVTVSLHTADPGLTGANEISGGSPAYARQAISYNAAATANLDSSNTPVFDIPAGVTVAYVGYWNAGGTFRGGNALTNEVFTNQGEYTLNDSDINLNDA